MPVILNEDRMLDIIGIDDGGQCWRFEWLTKHYSVLVKLPNGKHRSIETTFGDCLVKIKKKGVAFCKFCNCDISYGKTGRHALVNHVSSLRHAANFRDWYSKQISDDLLPMPSTETSTEVSIN